MKALTIAALVVILASVSAALAASKVESRLDTGRYSISCAGNGDGFSARFRCWMIDTTNGTVKKVVSE